eukprot:XP_011683650.1 PREDICTED: cytochrome b5 reductase 4 [Strongylocentrotus purpuratus]
MTTHCVKVQVNFCIHEHWNNRLVFFYDFAVEQKGELYVKALDSSSLAHACLLAPWDKVFCDLVLLGQVYNVTPYMEYHPGGAEELMKGLGIDATDLFNEVHRWVNVESMLEKCHIGPLQKGDPLAFFKVPDKKSSPSKMEQAGSYTIKWPDTVEKIPWYMCKLRGRDNKVRAKHDWYQMGDQVVVSIYVKCHYFTTDYVIVDLKEKTLKVTLYLDSQYFTLHLELPEEVHPNIKVTQRKGNMPMRCDLWLKKKNPNIKWTTLGLPLDDHKKTAPATDYEPAFRSCTLSKRTAVTHDTYLMTFDLPEGTQFKVPVGNHVYLKANINGKQLLTCLTLRIGTFQ